MTINEAELRKLAEAATPGEWDFDTAETPYRLAGGEVVGGDALPYGDVYTMDEYETPEGLESLIIANEISAANGRYIAAANPATVIALLDEIATLKACVAACQRSLIDHAKMRDANLAEVIPGAAIQSAEVADADKVICPNCVHQFRAVPVNVQARLTTHEQTNDPIGWLYDWTHSSATGRADECFTSFTAKREDAFKSTNHNQRLVCLATLAATPAQPIAPAADVSAPTDERVIDLMHSAYRAIHDAYLQAFGEQDPNIMSNDIDWHICELIRAAAPVGGPSDGCVLAPHYRGYANLGTGQYLLNHSATGEVVSLVISVATDEEKAGRVVGDELANPTHALLQPEAMAVRIDFTTVAGLDALENQLRKLRADHFIDSRPRSEDSRAEALEDAARICDEISVDPDIAIGVEIERAAAAIRALASSAAPADSAQGEG